jgi:hypothetical protein
MLHSAPSFADPVGPDSPDRRFKVWSSHADHSVVIENCDGSQHSLFGLFEGK